MLKACRPLQPYQQRQKFLPQPGVQVQHDQADVDHANTGVPQSGHHSRQGASPLHVAELAFHRVSIPFVLPRLGSGSRQFGRVFLRLSPGAAQWRA